MRFVSSFKERGIGISKQQDVTGCDLACNSVEVEIVHRGTSWSTKASQKPMEHKAG
jgi:hypothetical protein